MSGSSAHAIECPSSADVSEVSISDDIIDLDSCDKMDFDVDLLFASIELVASLIDLPVTVETTTT